MVGLGGGLIYSPLFILLQFPVNTAVSASLFLNGIAAVSAAITYSRKKMIDLKIGMPLIISSSLLAPLGAYSTSHINRKLFIAILAGVILLAAIRMLFFKIEESKEIHISIAPKIIGSGIIGMIIGFVAGLLGIGGGVFIVPLLVFILRIPAKTAAATSMFVVIFSSFSGFVAHISIARPDWKFILLTAVFSFAGGQLGSRIMVEKLSSSTVRKIFGVVLLVFVLKLLQKIFS
ncbi:MAG: sulfite exporter TauE/SafE family protein [Deltaproteobacteria bacterium]|nr:MAG: sulfite exporter TauE/SafE family protein [Deltaproteobacteria bacterium]